MLVLIGEIMFVEYETMRERFYIDIRGFMHNLVNKHVGVVHVRVFCSIHTDENILSGTLNTNCIQISLLEYNKGNYIEFGYTYVANFIFIFKIFPSV